MKGPKTFIVTALLSAPFGFELWRSATAQTCPPTKPEAVVAGAVYCRFLEWSICATFIFLVLVLTNEPDGNYIVPASIGEDGKLSLEAPVWTGGNGTCFVIPIES